MLSYCVYHFASLPAFYGIWYVKPNFCRENITQWLIFLYLIAKLLQKHLGQGGIRLAVNSFKVNPLVFKPMCVQLNTSFPIEMCMCGIRPAVS